MDMKALGNRIKKARREKNISSEILADRCFITPTYLRQLEAGLKTPSLPTFITICQALNVSPSYLLSDYIPVCNETSVLLEQLMPHANASQQALVNSMVSAAIIEIEQENTTKE